MSTTTKSNGHEHSHSQSRFAVLPTALRLDSDVRRTGRGTTIAFLDSGFYPHPDLTEPTSRIAAYHDITEPSAALKTKAQPDSWDWHGTQTSVVAAGNGYLSDGVYRGLASGARVVLVKVGERGRVTEENIARGIEWIVENKDRYDTRVLSISLGGDGDITYRESVADRAAEEAVRRGLVVVVAAGNSGNSDSHTPIPPANSPSVITVGGYDDKNRLGGTPDLYWSSYGPTADGILKPEIIAPAMWVAAPILPGSDFYERAEALSQIAHAPDYLLDGIAHLMAQPDHVLSGLASELWQKAGLPESSRRVPADRVRALVESRLDESKIIATHYQHVDGTSFAAPIVASVVAQMLEANPQLTPAAVKHILISTADRIQGAAAMRQGYGVLNARRAVEVAAREHHSDAGSFACPPRIEGGKLVFSYHNDAARRVALAGDFNGWDPASTRFVKLRAGEWRAEIAPPPPGRYQYKFIVDEGRWVDDPGNAVKEPDSYGGLNSVINLA